MSVAAVELWNCGAVGCAVVGFDDKRLLYIEVGDSGALRRLVVRLCRALQIKWQVLHVFTTMGCTYMQHARLLVDKSLKV